MNKISRRAALAGCLVSLMATCAAWAQQPQTIRVRGVIEKMDGQNLTIKGRDGANVVVALKEDARVMAFVKASLADIKPGAYIGVAAMPQEDGSQRALAVHIFLEQQRGTAEGFRPWDLRPNSTMTNAAVDTIVASADGQVVMVKYKDGEKKIIIPPDTPIVTYASGDRSEVKPGAQILIFGAVKQSDGSLQASAINVGRNLTPPM